MRPMDAVTLTGRIFARRQSSNGDATDLSATIDDDQATHWRSFDSRSLVTGRGMLNETTAVHWPHGSGR